MSAYHTVFGSLDNYEKGHIEIINDKPRNFAFSNIFEVAEKSKPYEMVVVAKNLDNVIEAVRAEGESEWFTASHDEFALAMDGEIEIHFHKAVGDEIVPELVEGTQKVGHAPQRPEDGPCRSEARASSDPAEGKRLSVSGPQARSDHAADHSRRQQRPEMG